MTDNHESEGAARSAPSAPADTSAIPVERAEAIKAVRLRHPWRNTVAVILIILVLLFILDAAQRQAFQWDIVGKYLFDTRVTEAAFITLALTVLAMLFGIVLGLVLAVMRLSPNPVLKWIAWAFLWVFRGTPVYVQLVFWGLVTLIYKTFIIGIPFVHTWAEIPISWTPPLFLIAVVGLALNESAYMAEIVRAGLLSVDPGQEEACTALGMSWGQTMRRVVIPQAMRVIIPPTGNEVISMLKTTSLVVAIPYTLDLFGRTRDISATIFAPIPLLIVASVWYLFFTSVLMVGQYFVEKRFSRGSDRSRPVIADVVGIEIGGKG
ncbi:ABC transporter permease subunit [Microbacterium sp. SYP-A9085]|jgi:polar amino acid transport system permease protein|uniref:amino acid ABC transporter permease n=1 Tax=Microbacterium sp. SYP-A9085 TaxID=2664454 RepID=UPI00129B25A7|nr:amino acid ABC transporter permease [Microbacterium sp. SYP-A9085]MRH28355.1 ABC transporter permease subunit [Microbacterium sp. SYP-A9085]